MSSSKKLSRRNLLKGAALATGTAVAGSVLSGCATKVVKETVEVEKEVTKIVEATVEVEKQVTSVVEKEVTTVVEKVVEVTPTGPTNSAGIVLPADALPLDQQTWKIGNAMTAAHGHWMKSLYNLLWGNTMHDEPLVGLDYNGDPFPCGCESWTVSEDNLNWDFYLRKDLTWTDGSPVTALDWEWTLKYTMGNNYDFGWYYSDVKNALKVLNGELPKEDLGIQSIDDYTLRITTELPTPYFPSVMCFFMPMSKAAFEKYGEMYELDPETFNGCGPWTLTKFDRATGCEWKLNTNYKGVRQVYFESCYEGPLSSGLAAYMSGDIYGYSMSASTPPGEQAFINTNPVLRAESHPVAPNITYYVGFDTLPDHFAPLDNADVRLALCKAIDKETMVGQVGKGFASAAWGMLPPGFVNNNDEVLKALEPNVFDVEAARQLLSKAGYPDGKGFPEFDMWVRDAVTGYDEAVQAAWKDNLGIKVNLKGADYAGFTAQVWGNRVAPIYRVAYSLDYFDPSTFLNIWRDGCRHPTAMPEWTEKYNTANSTMDSVQRFELLKQAEIDLVNSTVFFGIWCDLYYSLYPCNLGGNFMLPDHKGYINAYALGRSANNDLYWTNSTCRASLKS